jgi:TRAP-type C4-dicarboxylate transport system permease large subunit
VIGLALMTVTFLIAKIQGHPPSGERVRIRNILKAFGESIFFPAYILFIVGSIMLGIATATEAAIIGSFGPCSSAFLSIASYTARPARDNDSDVKITGSLSSVSPPPRLLHGS